MDCPQTTQFSIADRRYLHHIGIESINEDSTVDPRTKPWYQGSIKSIMLDHDQAGGARFTAHINRLSLI